MEKLIRPSSLSIPILLASLAFSASAQDPAVASAGNVVHVDPRVAAALQSAPSADLLEKLEVEVSGSDGFAKMKAKAKLWFLGAVRYFHTVESAAKKKIEELEKQRRNHERDGDKESVERVADEIQSQRQQIEQAYSAFSAGSSDKSGGPLRSLFVDLRGPFGPQIADSIVRSSLPELKRDLQAESGRSKVPADREELRRLIGRIDEVLSKIEKGDLSGADDVLRQEWQRVMEPEGGASAASASEPSIPDTAQVAWPLGVRDEQARQRWEKVFEPKSEDSSQPIEAWRLMTKRSYVLFFVGIGEVIADQQRQLERLKKERAECEEMGDKAGAKELAERIQSVVKSLETTAVTRLDIAGVGPFFLPDVSGPSRDQAQMRAKSLEQLGTYLHGEARGATPADVARAKWLIERANLAAEHLRNRKHRDAERVCDEVVRWILDAVEPLQHEPGSPSFGNLAGK